MNHRGHMDDRMDLLLLGEVEVVVVELGRPIARAVHQNMVVKEGYGALLDALAGTACHVNHMGLGDSPKTIGFEDQGMPHLVATITPTVTVNRDDLTMTFTGRLLQGEGNGNTFYDVAVFLEDGTMFNRAVFRDANGNVVGYEKTSSRELQIRWKVRVGTIGVVEDADGTYSTTLLLPGGYGEEPGDWPHDWEWPPSDTAPATWPDSWDWPPKMWPPFNVDPVPLSTWDPAGPPPPWWPSGYPWPATGQEPEGWPDVLTWPPPVWPPLDY